MCKDQTKELGVFILQMVRFILIFSIVQSVAMKDLCH